MTPYESITATRPNSIDCKMRRKFLVASAALGLSACGGGDARTAGLDYTQLAWFEGTLVDVDTGAPVNGATVYIPYGNNSYSTTTGSDGKYNFKVAISDLSGLAIWVLKFFKDGYQPRFVTYNGPISGATTYQVNSNEGALTKLLPNEYTSISYARLLHIGDASFSGSANSQLQVSTVGPQASSAVFTWDPSMNGKFRSALVSLQMRGLQGTSLKGGLLALVDAQNNVVGNVFPLDFNTDSQGGYNLITFTVQLPSTVASGEVSVYAQSGGNGSGDRDDLEYTGISVHLLP
jgi:hypothetical protein